MKKYLVTIEFRYTKIVDNEKDYFTKKITIGVYDDFGSACIYGNKEIEKLENKFKRHVFPGGNEAKKERFSLKGGCFGSKKNLITDLAYLKTPFSFFAKITTLNYNNIDDIIDDILKN
jgi:hypothetical protein